MRTLPAASHATLVARALAALALGCVGVDAVAATPAAAGVPTAAAAPQASRTSASVRAQAVALRQQGQHEAAAQLLLAWLTDQPEDALAHHELGVLYALHQQLRDAEAQFAAALRLDPQGTASRLALAELLRADERCPQAIGHYVQSVAVDPRGAVARKGLVLCHATLGDWPAAIAAAEGLAKEPADSAAAAWAQERLVTLRSLQASGGMPVGQMDAEGKALFAEKRFADAVVWLAEAQRSQPSADRAYRLAMAQLGAQDLLASQQTLQQALRLDPQHQPALMALPTVAKAVRTMGKGGVDLATVRRSESPEAAVARALLDNDRLLARQLLHAALLARSAAVPLAAAATAVDLAGAASPVVQGPPLVLWLLSGELSLREGDNSKAAQWLERVLKAAPQHDAARKGLVEAWYRLGRLADARRLSALPPPPAHITDDTDLLIYIARRREELQHQLRMMLDPGRHAEPSLLDQVAVALPPPPPPPPPPVEEPPAEPPPPQKGAKAKGAAKGAKPGQRAAPKGK